ncbi:MAG: hypothetical protein ACOC0H_06425, partial [Thermodesulfobacteriota bacterium]
YRNPPQEEQSDLIPQGTPITRDFWESMTLDELAEAQNARPVTDAETLLSGWPGNPEDGFEEENHKIRQRGMIGEKCNPKLDMLCNSEGNLKRMIGMKSERNINNWKG